MPPLSKSNENKYLDCAPSGTLPFYRLPIALQLCYGQPEILTLILTSSSQLRGLSIHLA